MDQSKHAQGVTSVKVNQQSGGNQTYNIFGNDPDADKERFAGKVINKPVVPVAQPEEEEKKEEEDYAKQLSNQGVSAGGRPEQKTSVKVHNPPGGKSSITFG